MCHPAWLTTGVPPTVNSSALAVRLPIASSRKNCYQLNNVAYLLLTSTSSVQDLSVILPLGYTLLIIYKDETEKISQVFSISRNLK